jgi:hypothetical protein
MRLNRSFKISCWQFVYIVACSTVVMQRSREGTCITAGKHVNDIRAIDRQPPITTIKSWWRRCFLLGPHGGYTARTLGRLTEFRWGYSPDSNDMSTEAGESSLLCSVTRKRLVKANWEDSVWELAIVFQLFVVTTCKWSIDLFTNPNSVYIHSYTW